MGFQMATLARSLGGQIANTLRAEILVGSINAGVHLQEAKLAERFGVSRGPVRDALLELSKEGFVVPKSRGCTVAESAPDSIQTLVLPIRRTLECFALGLVFDSVKDEHFRKWDEILAAMRRACLGRDEAMIVEQDIAFHRSILEMAEQPDLLAIWMTIVARIRRYFLEGCRRYSNPMDQYAEHEELVRIFRERKKAKAIKALEAHIK
jgi:DNA-binding GntR family transcriptional regulator